MVFYQSNNHGYKFGVVASKKVGKAVVRNRAKRLLKSLMINHLNKLEKGNYILVAKPLIVKSDYGKLQKSFFKALKRLNAIKQ